MLSNARSTVSFHGSYYRSKDYDGEKTSDDKGSFHLFGDLMFVRKCIRRETSWLKNMSGPERNIAKFKRTEGEIFDTHCKTGS